jgi:hypothetical protein
MYGAVKLDMAIKKAADYILDTAENNKIVAFVRINSESERLSLYILNELPNYTVNDPRSKAKGLTFVDRGVMFTHTENELTFQYSGEVSDEKMASLGKRAGAQLIVSGGIIEKGDNFSMNIKMIDVETAKILGSNSFEIIADADMFSYIANSAIERRRIEAANKKAAQEREEEARKAASAEKRKNALGLFSDGGYIGYLYSPGLPLGFSLGSIRNTVGLFLDAQADVHFKAWDALAGLNIRIVPSFLWLSAGGGAYSNEIGEFGGVVSLGALVKVWHIYALVKYRYIIGNAYDPMDIWNINHLDVGLGFVWRTR